MRHLHVGLLKVIQTVLLFLFFRLLTLLLDPNEAYFGEDFIGNCASLSETPAQLHKHALFLHYVIHATL